MSNIARRTRGGDPWQHRVDSADWEAITSEVNMLGGALLPELLTPAEAEQIRGLYGQAGYFRSTVNMGQHRFGEGEYRYFKTPYPEPVERLKQALYPRCCRSRVTGGPSSAAHGPQPGPPGLSESFAKAGSCWSAFAW